MRLLALGFLVIITVQAQDSAVWQPAARMLEARTGHCAVGLKDGRILIAGGTGVLGPLSTTEIYGPEDIFQTAPAMAVGRTGHRCTLLEDGRVLVSGGSTSSSAEVFDPVAVKWTSVTGDLWTAQNHTATLLPTGLVLLAGGFSAGEPTTTIASYDPATNQISRLPVPLMDARTSHTAELLPNGRVMFAGGIGQLGVLSSVELLDPSIPRIVPGAQLNTSRTAHASARLLDGRVLITGGSNGDFDLDNAEIYSPNEDRWAWVNALMASPRKDLLAVSLPSGKILLAGGDLNGTPLGLTETFDPETATFERAGYLTAPRAGIAGVILPLSGLVLGTGGRNESGSTNICGILTSPNIRLTNSSGLVPHDFVLGETVYASGSGFSITTSGVSFTVLRSDGVAITGTRLLTPSVRTLTGSFRVPLFTADVTDLGKFQDVTATQGKIIATARSHVAASITLRPVNAPISQRASTSLSYAVGIDTPNNIGPINGVLEVTVGSVRGTAAVAAVAPGVIFNVTVCCQVAGTYQPKIRFLPTSALYLDTTITAPTLTLSPQPVEITFATGARTGFPLFQSKVQGVVISGQPGLPVPTGQVNIVHIRPGAFSANLPLVSGVTSAGVSITYKATFEDRTSGVCFDASYAGDATYAPTVSRICGITTPALPFLRATAEPFLPDAGPSQASVTITFPPELGLVNRRVAFQLPSPSSGQVTDGTSNTLIVGEATNCVDFTSIGVGTATGSSPGACFVKFPSGATSATLQYGGGGDLAPASFVLPLQQAKWPTITTLSAVQTAPGVVALTVTVDESSSVCRRTLPPPQGAVRFFDGTLFVGELFLQFGTSCDSPSFVTLTVGRPAGTRQFRAEFPATAAHQASVSPTVSLLVQ